MRSARSCLISLILIENGLTVVFGEKGARNDDGTLFLMNPVLVGIVGGSGSGKTTLAKGVGLLTARFGCRILSQDHYYIGIPQGLSAEMYNFDDPAALDLKLLVQHLAAIGQGRAVAIPQYDFSSHQRRSQSEMLTPVPLIIVEGLFLYTSDALRDSFDLRFFVDVPVAERLRRRIARDTVERGRTVEDIVRQFEQQAEPAYQRHILPTRRHAHHVLDIPYPDDRVYCEQMVAMWGRIEQLLREREFASKMKEGDRIS